MTEAPTIDSLDFSQWHPLDHRAGSRYCWSLHGGPRHHVRLWWVYLAAPKLRARLLCRRGWHDWCEGARGRQAAWFCWDCSEFGGPR